MPYQSNISDESWSILSSFFESDERRGRPRVFSFREIVNACFYVSDNGNKWRNLPSNFPSWKTVYHYFNKWSKNGLWEDMNATLVAGARVAGGRDSTPSLVSIDSQSQTAEPGIKGRGLDGGKKVNGRKRHIAVDTMGLVILCIVSAANVSDARVGNYLVDTLNKRNLFPRIKKILGDRSYRCVGKNYETPVTVEAFKGKRVKGFVPEPFRWVVERTFSWLNRSRRIVRNYEKSPIHQESMNYIANIRICIKKIDKVIKSRT